jgi:hypothetical protein
VKLFLMPAIETLSDDQLDALLAMAGELQGLSADARKRAIAAFYDCVRDLRKDELC